VPQHEVRLNPPGTPQLGESDFHGKEGGLGIGRLIEETVCRLVKGTVGRHLLLSGEENGEQRPVQVGA